MVAGVQGCFMSMGYRVSLLCALVRCNPDLICDDGHHE
jgi:hypothetical protein